MLPNFLIVGAEKAGTTTLAAGLSRHPQVFISEPKEPRFFSGHSWDKGREWYESLFADAGDARAAGEASTAYTWYPEIAGCPRRIRETLGDIRYIYIVRHPVERLLSHVRHARFHRWIPDTYTPAQAVEARPAIRDCGRYAYQLQQYAETTGPEQWHILALEDLSRTPREQMSRVFAFLGVDPDFTVEVKHLNKGDRQIRLPSWYHRLGAGRWGKRIRGSRVHCAGRRIIGNLAGRIVPPPELTADEYARWQEYFREDAERLSERTGHDFLGLWGYR